MNIEEVEAPQKYQNLQTKPVLDPFKSTAEHRKVRELPRKMNIEEVEEPETTKIYRPNPLPSVAATPKLRKFTDETNIQARNHENSDEICAQPVRHLDLATPAFTTTVRTPSVTTLFGEKHILQDLTEFDPSNSMEGQPPKKRGQTGSLYHVYLN